MDKWRTGEESWMMELRVLGDTRCGSTVLVHAAGESEQTGGKVSSNFSETTDTTDAVSLGSVSFRGGYVAALPSTS